MSGLVNGASQPQAVASHRSPSTTGIGEKPRLVAVLLLLLGTALAFGAVDESKAAGVMAAYLRHIAAMTTWPGEAAGGSGRPILIGVVGADPNGVMAPIRERSGSKQRLLAQGRPIRVVDISTRPEAPLETLLGSCALLFVSAGAEDAWARIKPLVGSLPIVTVSELDGFAESGGMVEYFVDLATGKVRLIVNLTAMRRAGIVLSARLLALESVIVVDDREEAS